MGGQIWPAGHNLSEWKKKKWKKTSGLFIVSLSRKKPQDVVECTHRSIFNILHSAETQILKHTVNPPCPEFCRALLKNQYGNILRQSFSWYLYRMVTRIISWSPCQNPALQFSDTKELYLHYFDFSVSTVQWVHLKCKSALEFHFSFWCFGSYISVFCNLPTPFK